MAPTSTSSSSTTAATTTTEIYGTTSSQWTAASSTGSTTTNGGWLATSTATSVLYNGQAVGKWKAVRALHQSKVLNPSKSRDKPDPSPHIASGRRSPLRFIKVDDRQQLYKLFPDGTFNTDPTINVKSFVENFKKSSYQSVKEMIEDKRVLVSNDATASCGFSDPAQTSFGALNDTVYWGRNDDITLDEGFVHMGPCESGERHELPSYVHACLGKGCSSCPD
ncbi:unnamed protein product [Phytophthora lilii]|uniref:Unnamed protein product n=1 Tax=Phytophthora lilii TaxID=2077276 RepID=A0A9W7D8L4_9STRA|nr:unnamed protein product [Phytophthora lilii]